MHFFQEVEEVNEEKEYEKLSMKLNFLIAKAMKKGVPPKIIRRAMKECAYCILFNSSDEDFQESFGKQEGNK